MADEEREKAEAALNARLDAIAQRLEWISNSEARSAWVQGLAARGLHEPERDQLIKETEDVLDKLQALGGSLKFHPKA